MAEIDAGRLRAGEEEELREERRRLMSAERLAEGANGAYRELYDDPASAVERAGRAASLLRDLVRLDPRVQPTVQALDTALVHLDETARALRSYRDGVVFDPPRLGRSSGAWTRSVASSGVTRGEHRGGARASRAGRSDLEGLSRAGESESRLVRRVDRLRTELTTRATDLAERRERAVGHPGPPW
jgi:DNA repair protein RecN (Recombination protein N)